MMAVHKEPLQHRHDLRSTQLDNCRSEHEDMAFPYPRNNIDRDDFHIDPIPPDLPGTILSVSGLPFPQRWV